MQNVEDLKALEKLQRSDTNGQLQGLTDQAAQDESDRQQDDRDKDSAQQFNIMVETQMEKESEASPTEESSAQQPSEEHVAKVKELSSKLGVLAKDTDAFLGSKTEIAQVMVKRAIQAGKTQEQIKSALTG